MVGRGMRKSLKTGKHDCRVIDLADSLERVGGIISGPVLFQQEADEIIDEPSSVRGRNLRSNHGGPGGIHSLSEVKDVRVVELVDREDPFSLAMAVPSDGLKSFSHNAWVECRSSIWVLYCLSEGSVKVEETKHRVPASAREIPKFDVYFFPRDTKKSAEEKSNYYLKQSNHLGSSPTLREAIEKGDRYAADIVGPGQENL
ncbi:hypothetical protein FRC05_010800 [Tulasnella sp. 425]|nr:hypothetical protein FRC05_010800 [Tulasnella sp. 425]